MQASHKPLRLGDPADGGALRAQVRSWRPAGTICRRSRRTCWPRTAAWAPQALQRRQPARPRRRCFTWTPRRAAQPTRSVRAPRAAPSIRAASCLTAGLSGDLCAYGGTVAALLSLTAGAIASKLHGEGVCRPAIIWRWPALGGRARSAVGAEPHAHACRAAGARAGAIAVKEEGGLPDTPGAELPSQEVHLLQQYADTLLQARPRACARQPRTLPAASCSWGSHAWGQRGRASPCGSPPACLGGCACLPPWRRTLRHAVARLQGMPAEENGKGGGAAAARVPEPRPPPAPAAAHGAAAGPAPSERCAAWRHGRA